MSALWLLDTKILLRLTADPSMANVDIAVSAVDLLRASASLCYASQNIGEFWNACTRPIDKNGFGLSVHQTQMHIVEIEKNFELLEDSRAVHCEWLRLLSHYQVPWCMMRTLSRSWRFMACGKFSPSMQRTSLATPKLRPSIHAMLLYDSKFAP